MNILYNSVLPSSLPLVIRLGLTPAGTTTAAPYTACGTSSATMAYGTEQESKVKVNLALQYFHI